MPQVLALVVGAVAGFVGSRLLRRPAHTASAASVARNVGGALGARKGLSAPELQRATFSEMMRHVRVTRPGTTAVPVRYLVRLHPSDAAVVEESPRYFVDGLSEALRAAAASNSWSIEGSISIKVEADGTRRPGAPAVLAVPPGSPSTNPPTSPPDAPAAAEPERKVARPVSGPHRMVLHRLDTEERILLSGERVTIGRSSDRDVVIDDTRISRHHAVVGPHDSGWILTDEHSSNGTRLNGSALAANRSATLRAGDVIQVGPVRFRFDVDDRAQAPGVATGDEAASEDATRVLDDATRRRLSVEHLGPVDDSHGASEAGDQRT